MDDFCKAYDEEVSGLPVSPNVRRGEEVGEAIQWKPMAGAAQLPAIVAAANGVVSRAGWLGP